MKNLKIASFSALSLALVLGATMFANPASAQQAGPGRGPQGGGQFGGPGGAPGGQRGGMRMGGPMLLNRTDVQKELKMTEDQIAKIREILPAPPMGGPQGGPPGQGGGVGGQRGGQQGQGGNVGGQGGGQRGGQQGGRQGQGGLPGGPGGMQGNAEMEGKIKAILNSSQYSRYKELELQFIGAPALVRPDVAEKVGLSEKQITDIRDLLQGGMRGPGGPAGQQGRGGQQGGQQGQGGQRGGQQGGQGQGGNVGGQRGQGGVGGPGGPPPNQGQMDQRRKEQEAKILAILTGDQRSKWETMKGKAFKFEVMPAPGRGGRGGSGGS